MGLDNIPQEYPCVKQGVAIMTGDNRIDCDATINSGKCPWKVEHEKSYLVKDTKPTYGMFGTPCWYRGKYGNFLVSMLSGSPDSYADTAYSFYGDGEGENEGMSTEYCLEMNEYMTDNIERFASQARLYRNSEAGKDIDLEETIKDYMYATWWLKFAAEHCNGSKIWY